MKNERGKITNDSNQPCDLKLSNGVRQINVVLLQVVESFTLMVLGAQQGFAINPKWRI